MAYELDWGSDKPGHIVFLVDLSGSMAADGKIDYVIDALYSTCRSIVTRCKAGMTIKNRVSVTVIGYNYQTKILLEAKTTEQLARKLSDVKRSGKPMFDKDTEAKPEYQTCMQKAFEAAKLDIETWIKERTIKETLIPAPVVINITDGYPYEGDKVNQADVYANTLRAAQKLMQVSTHDGNVRIFNIHHDPSYKGSSLKFPSIMPSDERQRFLYQASSALTPDMLSAARAYFPDVNVSNGAKCMISNESDVSNIVKFLEWGSS